MTDFSSFTGGPPNRDVTAVMGRRILAWVVDLVIFLGISVATFAALAEYTEIPSSFVGDACSQLTDTAAASDEIADIGACFEVNDRAYTTTEDEGLLQTGVSLAYLIAFVVLQGIAGGSPGKLVTGLRVVKEDGRRAGVGRSAVRTLLWVVDGAPWFAPLVGFIVGLTTTGHRRVGDFVAKTYVISRKDMGSPVSTGVTAPPPAGQQPWGAPPPMGAGPSGPPTVSPPPPVGAGAEPWQTPSPQPTPPSAPPADLGPTDGGGVVGPPPLPSPGPASYDAARPWDAPSEAAVPEPDAAAPSAEADSPTAEAASRADEAAPELGADPSWYSGPEADPPTGVGAPDPSTEPPTTEPLIDAPDTNQPSVWEPTDPATEWAPPTTPTDDIDLGDNASPTAGPGGFVAPGSEPPASPAAEPQPASSPAAPPPQWDQARNTYIQWDPNQQQWLQWDTVANRWKLIDT